MPFGGLGVTAALGLASAGYKAFTGYQQQQKANNLQLMDTTTPEEREQLAMSRQAAASGQMPGQGVAQNRLGMVQSGALQNAQMGAASGSDFLAAAGAADARRQLGEQQLSTQSQQFQNVAKGQLRRDLTTASQRRQHDLDTYNQNKAALTSAAGTNMGAAIDTAGSFGAMGVNMYRSDNGLGGGQYGAQTRDAAMGEGQMDPLKIGISGYRPLGGATGY